MYNYQYIAGTNNEKNFVKYLNGKQIDELNPLFKEFVLDLFGNVNEKSYINSYLSNKKIKTDIFIEINNIRKSVSIKMGSKNSVHVERISDFIDFLKANNISSNNIKEYLKYHYADGTTNGTGKIRLSAEQYKEKNQNIIDEINFQLNNSKIIIKALDRFVFKGKDNNSNVDVIVHGTVNDFLWIKKKDAIQFALSKKNQYSTAIHFGPMTCQPMDRCLNYNSKYENRRYCIQIKWYNLIDNIIENMNSKIANKIL